MLDAFFNKAKSSRICVSLGFWPLKHVQQKVVESQKYQGILGILGLKNRIYQYLQWFWSHHLHEPISGILEMKRKNYHQLVFFIYLQFETVWNGQAMHVFAVKRCINVVFSQWVGSGKAVPASPGLIGETKRTTENYRYCKCLSPLASVLCIRLHL